LSQDAERIFVTISVPTVGFGQPTFKYFYYEKKGQSTSLSAVVDYNSELVEFGLWTGWLAPHWQELRRHNQTKHNNTPNDRCLMAYASWVEEGRSNLDPALDFNLGYPALS